MSLKQAVKHSYLPACGGSFRAPSEINSCSAATRASAEGGVGKGKLTTCTTRKLKPSLSELHSGNHQKLSGMSDLICLTLSIFRSFICKTRSSTGLRVISASENRLKSPNTAEEYSLQIHTGILREYEGSKHGIIPAGLTVLTCSSAQALFGQLYLPSDWLRPEKPT